MRAKLFLGVAILLAAAVGSSSAQHGEAERPGRFVLQPIDGGVLRLDTQTGAVSLCTGRGSTWSCDAVSDQRTASSADIGRLEADNLALKTENQRLAEQLAATTPSAKRFELPSERDVDAALDYAERMLKKFKDRLKSFDGGPGRGNPM